MPMTPKLVLDEYSHGVRVSGYTRDTYPIIASFLETLTLKVTNYVRHKGYVVEVKKRFYGQTDNGKEVFLHRHHLPDFLHWVTNRGIQDEYIQRNAIPAPPSASATFSVKDHIAPREAQVPIVESLTEVGAYSRGVKAQTGFGKSVTTLMALTQLKQRFVVMVPPKYFGLWRESIQKDGKNIEGNYLEVAGSGALKALMQKALDGDLTEDIILISHPTYRAYIEAYERFGAQIEDIGYPVPPYRLHELLEAGVQVNDEIQDDPGLVFRTDIYTNVQRQIYLSATPYTGDDFVTKMIDVMIPEEVDVPLPNLDVYINVLALLYSDNVQPKDYLIPGKRAYNHARYEKRMLTQKKRLKEYTRLVCKAVQGLYVKDREPGQRMLVLSAYVEFIHYLTQQLKQAFPELKIVAHVAGSSYANILKADVIVSTIKSSGTGVDIPNLRELLMLQATDSRKDNIQVLGRPRRLKDWPDVHPRMTYFVCQNIPKHLNYHRSKTQYFTNRVLSHKTMRLS